MGTGIPDGGKRGVYERTFDYLVQKINAPESAAFLDAGCGSGSHSIRLAKRGAPA